MQEYVVCLLFNETLTEVALIEKKRPQWQAGKLNGVGGKIEAGEHPIRAAEREFEEETGIRFSDWETILEQTDASKDKKYRVYYFAGVARNGLGQLRTTTDEEIRVLDVRRLNCELVELVTALEWIIPLSVYCLSEKMNHEQCIIKY